MLGVSETPKEADKRPIARNCGDHPIPLPTTIPTLTATNPLAELLLVPYALVDMRALRSA